MHKVKVEFDWGLENEVVVVAFPKGCWENIKEKLNPDNGGDFDNTNQINGYLHTPDSICLDLYKEIQNVIVDGEKQLPKPKEDLKLQWNHEEGIQKIREYIQLDSNNEKTSEEILEDVCHVLGFTKPSHKFGEGTGVHHSSDNLLNSKEKKE